MKLVVLEVYILFVSNSLIWADIWKFIFICFQQLIWADTGSTFKATKSCLLYTFIVFNSSGFYER